MGRTQENRSLVKVIHGANDGEFDLSGHTVGVARSSLEVVFNIPIEAAAFVNGEAVHVSYVLAPNDCLEFVKQFGIKGLGDLLTPEEIKARWRLNVDQYQELRDRGLPTITFADGTARHPEVLVDQWWKSLDGHAEEAAPQQSSFDDWAHSAGTEPPSSYSFGPLEGTQKELASWLHPQGKDDARHLHTKAKSGGVWVKKVHTRHYEVWFRNQQAFEAAQRRRQASKPPETA